MKHIISITLLIFFFSSTSAFAADKHVKGKAKQLKIVTAGSSGDSDTSALSSKTKNFKLAVSDSKARLYGVDNTGKLAGSLVSFTYKGKPITYSQLKKSKLCSKSSSRKKVLAYTGLKLSTSATDLGTLSKKAGGFLVSSKSVKNVDSKTKQKVNSDCSPVGATAETLGMPVIDSDAFGTTNDFTRISATATADDSDGDGLGNLADADDDNDSVIDSFDADSSDEARNGPSLFSNLKVSIENSLNINAITGVTEEQIDNLVSTTLTLAIPVNGGEGDTTELDCGGLTYCSAGGTGQTLESSISFPDDSDADADGKGEITSGSTGDFQLKANAAASEIGAGDMLVQVITDSEGVETEYPMMLNFVFNTTPAIKTITLGSTSFTPTYPVAQDGEGTTNNCFVAPAGWDQQLAITGWRAQRPGILDAGEAEYMDIGNATFSIDIPNPPCSTTNTGGCPGSTGSSCSTAAYSTTDSNLTAGAFGFTDSLGDTPADPANTFSFTVDLASCLGSTTWSSGQKLFIDLQQRSHYGDNAAQKFCIELP